jgi:hypothetical protein
VITDWRKLHNEEFHNLNCPSRTARTNRSSINPVQGGNSYMHSFRLGSSTRDSRKKKGNIKVDFTEIWCEAPE